MALLVENTTIGKIKIVEHYPVLDDREYTIEIRKANCLAAFIAVYSDETGENKQSLFGFYADEGHLRNIVKHTGNPFLWDDVREVELNLAYKECNTLLKYFVKTGMEIKCYYKPKQVKMI